MGAPPGGVAGEVIGEVSAAGALWPQTQSRLLEARSAMSSCLKALLVAGGLLLVLTGCYIPPSAGDLAKINIGMTKSSVTSHLGQPAYATGDGKTEVYHYRFVEGGRPFGKTSGYYVRIVDGQVESYGKEPAECTEAGAAPAGQSAK